MMLPRDVVEKLLDRSLVVEVTLFRYFTGLPVRPGTRERIERAARELGLEQYLPQREPEPVDPAAAPAPRPWEAPKAEGGGS